MNKITKELEFWEKSETKEYISLPSTEIPEAYIFRDPLRDNIVHFKGEEIFIKQGEELFIDNNGMKKVEEMPKAGKKEINEK